MTTGESGALLRGALLRGALLREDEEQGGLLVRDADKDHVDLRNRGMGGGIRRSVIPE
jgi:hypothetical protein